MGKLHFLIGVAALLVASLGTVIGGPVLKTPYEFIAARKTLTILKKAIDQAGLKGTLLSPRLNVTIFGPSDDAFRAFFARIQDEVRAKQNTPSFTYNEARFLADPQLRGVLLFHVAPGLWKKTNFSANLELPTLAGSNITLKFQRPRTWKVADAYNRLSGFTEVDKLAAGVIVHVIGGVLAPRYFSVIRGNYNPPAPPSPPRSPPAPPPPPPPPPRPVPPPTSLYQYISKNNKTLSTLKSLVDMASTPALNFTKVLSDTSQNITVFLPNNAAFATLIAKLGPAAPGVLNNASAIAGILTTHVLGRAVRKSGIRNTTILPTLFGINLTASVNRTATLIISPGAAAKLITSDIKGGVSVGHVVDAVLLPAALPPLPKPTPPTPPPKPVSPPAPSPYPQPGPKPISQPPSPPPEPVPVLSLYQIISAPAAQAQFSTLKSLVDLASSGLVNFKGVLSDPNNTITVFAPTNAAFAALLGRLGPAGANLATNVSAVTDILLTHVVGDPYPLSALTNGISLVTLNTGINLTVALSIGAVPPKVRITSPGSSGTIIQGDITGGKSYAHFIDTVLLPRTFPSAPESASPPPPPPAAASPPSPVSAIPTTYSVLASRNYTLLINLVDFVSKASLTNKNLTNWKAILTNNSAEYTLFAPANAAISALINQAGPVLAASVMTNGPLQNAILSAHVVGVKLTSINQGQIVTALGGQPTTFQVSGPNATVSNSFTTPGIPLSRPGIEVGQSITYPITGGVLLPLSMAQLVQAILG